MLGMKIIADLTQAAMVTREQQQDPFAFADLVDIVSWSDLFSQAQAQPLTNNELPFVRPFCTFSTKYKKPPMKH